MLSKEWQSAPGLISNKLYRVSANKERTFLGLEVQHVPGQSGWARLRVELDAPILIARLRYLAPGLHGTAPVPTACWSYMGGRGASTRTLARLTPSSTTYETSTDDGTTWRETSHPFALALRVLELDPAEPEEEEYGDPLDRNGMNTTKEQRTQKIIDLLTNAASLAEGNRANDEELDVHDIKALLQQAMDELTVESLSRRSGT